MLPNPQAREEIPVLPQEYQLTTNGDQFLVFDSGIGDPGRIFMFTSDLSLQFLYERDHWYVGGIFKVYPEIFYQVYTAHGQQRGRIFPCGFGLLSYKTEATYTRLFREFFIQLENLRNRNPDYILADFEKTAISSIQNFNPQFEVKGCFYTSHLMSGNVYKMLVFSKDISLTIKNVICYRFFDSC